MATFGSVVAISAGASLGALLRWQLAIRYNLPGAALSLGTLAANAVGGYVVGLAIAWFSSHPLVSPEWRLFIITGFCGGLTTFSTFSAEVVSLLNTGRLMAAFTSVAAHVLVSLLLTYAGIRSWQYVAHL
jgi:CrcB protein